MYPTLTDVPEGAQLEAIHAELTERPITRDEFRAWEREHKREAHTLMNGPLSRRVALAKVRARDIVQARGVQV